MKRQDVIDSIAAFVHKNRRNFKNKKHFEVYTMWALATGSIIREEQFLEWLLSFIDDLRSLPDFILKETYPEVYLK